VVRMGMSDLGPINLGPGVDIAELGMAWYEPNRVSEELLAKADEEIKKIVSHCADEAVRILTKNKDKLKLVAETLLKKETVEAEEFESLMAAKG